MPLVEFHLVNRWYGGVQAVKDLSFSLKEGEIGILIGPSGCGKSTTLKMVNRLLEPTSGSIIFKDKPLDSFDPVQLRRSIGYVIQNVGLFPHWTVFENACAVPRLLGWPEGRIRSRVDELLDLAGLPPGKYSSKFPSQLSGGEAQRVGIVRALAADPALLLMDEPFGSLDPLQKSRHQQALLDIQAQVKKTILMVTHDMDEAILMADRVLVMHRGRLVQEASPQTLLASPADDFIREFIGADRSLKRLIRIKTRDVLTPAASWTAGQASGEMLRSWSWVTDGHGRLKGWISREKLSRQESEREVASIPELALGVGLGTALKDVLSFMLATGMKVLPVTDREGLLLGEVSMDSVEALTKEDFS